MDKPSTDNGFSNDISSLFEKKTSSEWRVFSKVQHWRKYINKNKEKSISREGYKKGREERKKGRDIDRCLTDGGRG